MGMNPDTHQFEPLESLAAVEQAHLKGWKIFKTGEKVTLNGTDFTVTDIQQTKLVLRPFGLGLMAKEPEHDPGPHENKHPGPDLRSFSQAEIDNWFTYHAPTPEQVTAYHEIRTAAKIYAATVNRHVPACADKNAAMREIRGSIVAANLAIACYVSPLDRLKELATGANANMTVARDYTRDQQARTDIPAGDPGIDIPK